METSANIQDRNFNESVEGNESNENAEGNEGNISTFTHFLEEIKDDYKNGSIAITYCITQYPKSRVKSGSMIRVQVESVKRRKTEGSGHKRKLPPPTSELLSGRLC
ncbi:unnamed protein product [Rhizophagus irregularis]|uniref:Uncharacterized protein n=1 Tax=Rhizophagus irregularis TaxID=588596 RepID=A0A2I1GMD9_9GLOM|nr:hypothetical protein RhiirA4_463176 [Rhizophagus irregularis]CAB4404221.1 unnamed protein product [Rhizophagus irregularis]